MRTLKDGVRSSGFISVMWVQAVKMKEKLGTIFNSIAPSFFSDVLAQKKGAQGGRTKYEAVKIPGGRVHEVPPANADDSKKLSI